MTRQYVVGELSWLIAELGTVAQTDGKDLVRELWALRREAETHPPDTLGPVAERALATGDVLCWHSLSQGDIDTFRSQAGIVGRLYKFGICAGLLEEDWPDNARLVGRFGR